MTDTPGTLEERLRGGKCPQCQGWGEVAYFGEMVGCTCLGHYEAPISMATRTEAADEIASLRARVEAMREALEQLSGGRSSLTECYVIARRALKDAPDAE